MIYFITNNTNHIVETHHDIVVLNSKDGIDKVQGWAANLKGDFGQDTETTGLEPYLNDILLYILGDEYIQFVFDVNSISDFETQIKEIFYLLQGNTLIGANIKFDTSFNKTKYGFQFEDYVKIFDVMIADQRIYMNCDFSWGLKDIYIRHFKESPPDMDKDIRSDFSRMSINNIRFQSKHIRYAANDIKYLQRIKRRQVELIRKYEMEFLIYDIEMPLITVLSDMELEGIDFDKVGWQKLIDINKKKKYEAEVKLDEEIRQLRGRFIMGDEKDNINLLSLSNGKFDRPRKKIPTIIQQGLFGEQDNKDITPEKLKGNIDYNSVSEISKIFAKLKEPMPAKLDATGSQIAYLIPILKSDGRIESEYGLNRDGNKVFHNGFTTQEAYLEQYLIEIPDTSMKSFIKTFIEYRTAKTRIENFGANFFDKINPVTGRIHTVFRQCFSETGRLQSGGGKKQPDKINIQNQIADSDKIITPEGNEETRAPYRNCFTAGEGWSFITCDLAGAELIIICDKAKDLRLLELSKNDMHSHMANVCYSRLYENRGIPYTDADKISKKQNKDKRDAFKDKTFGTIYGMMAKKCAKSMNISVEEGQIVVNTIKAEIPLTFSWLQRKLESVLGKYDFVARRKWYQNPYLILNTRTNSRVWFQAIMEAKRTGGELLFKDEREIDGACRNSDVQGTQADMIKEALVEISRYIKLQNLSDKFKLLLTVHDEIGAKVHNSIKDNKYPFYEDNSEEVEYLTPQHIVERFMIKCANRYLTTVKMGAESQIHPYWNK